MGVYIPGIEMPENCICCDLSHEDGWCPAKQIFVDKYSYETCPLVPVPPHGRLVKASKVEFELCESNMPQKYRDFCRRVINDENLVPTIIPAEEDGT